MHIGNNTLNTIVTVYKWDKALKKPKMCQGPDIVQCSFFPYNSILELPKPDSDCNGPGNQGILWGKL